MPGAAPGADAGLRHELDPHFPVRALLAADGIGSTAAAAGGGHGDNIGRFLPALRGGAKSCFHGRSC